MQESLSKPTHHLTVPDVRSKEPASCDTAAMQIHLIRHGEVDNPGDVVYADIPGFVLSEKGRSQAKAAGEHLAAQPLKLIVTSPLDRAVETADLIAAATKAEVVVDDRLSEWGLAVRWRGATWAELPVAFPGELEAYLADPNDLPFCPESIEQVAERIVTAVDEWVGRTTGDIAFVSHEDPIHATRHRLTGIVPTPFHSDKPAHSSVTTLEPAGDGWEIRSYWSPKQ